MAVLNTVQEVKLWVYPVSLRELRVGEMGSSDAGQCLQENHAVMKGNTVITRYKSTVCNP